MSIHFDESVTPPRHKLLAHRQEAMELVKANVRPHDVISDAYYVPKIGTFHVGSGSLDPVDYVLAVGITGMLKPDVEHLCWFANQLQRYALKGMFVDFDPQMWTMGDIIAAFGMRPRADNTLVYSGGSEYLVYFRL